MMAVSNTGKRKGNTMNKSESIKELATALAKAQSEIENATKNAANPHFRSKYADLAEVLNTSRPVLSKHGISIMQFPAYSDGTASVETVVMHASGEWMSGVASCHVAKDDAQGIGSATTYLRRYSLAAIAGIAQEDDDGESAVGRKPQQRQEQQKPASNDGGFDKYESEMLPKLKDAALNGLGQLQDVFKGLPASEHKKALWAKHGDSLKKAAEQMKEAA